jgi:hypothetical protein
MKLFFTIFRICRYISTYVIKFPIPYVINLGMGAGEIVLIAHVDRKRSFPAASSPSTSNKAGEKGYCCQVLRGGNRVVPQLFHS